MKAEELREVAEAATRVVPSPGACPRSICDVGHNIERCPWLRALRDRERGAAVLVDHSAALAEMVAACERLNEAVSCGAEVPVTAQALHAVLGALAAVHAIGHVSHPEARSGEG